PDRRIPARRCELAAVPAECDRCDRVGCEAELPDTTACLDIEDSNALPAGRQLQVVRTECQRKHPLRFVVEDFRFTAGRQVPNLDGAIARAVGAACQDVSISAEGERRGSALL